jgi:hypothetical protein
MDDNVILVVGDKKFLLSMDEAMSVAKTLNSASIIERVWIKDVAHEHTHVIKPPGMVSYVAPMTVLLQMEIDANMKIVGTK